jgi:hypothetical protein
MFLANYVTKKFFDPHNTIISEDEQKKDFSKLVPELISKCFSYLKSRELNSCQLVCKTWNILASDDKLWLSILAQEIAFGEEDWKTYFGDPGEVPPLTLEDLKFMKKAGQTHSLTLIPEKIDNEILDLKKFEEMRKNPKKGRPTFTNFLGPMAKSTFSHYKNKKVDKSQWVYMLKYPISETKSWYDSLTSNFRELLTGKIKSYKEIQTLVSEFGAEYKIPNLFVASICIFTKDLKSKQIFDQYDSLMCEETMDGEHIALGHYKGEYLVVFYSQTEDATVPIRPQIAPPKEKID